MFQFWNGTPVPNNIVFDFVILWSGLPGLSLNFAPNDITNSLHIGWRVHNQKTRSVGLTKPYPPPRIRSMPKSKNFFYWWLPLVKWAKVLFCIYHIWLYIFVYDWLSCDRSSPPQSANSFVFSSTTRLLTTYNSNLEAISAHLGAHCAQHPLLFLSNSVCVSN